MGVSGFSIDSNPTEAQKIVTVHNFWNVHPVVSAEFLFKDDLNLDRDTIRIDGSDMQAVSFSMVPQAGSGYKYSGLFYPHGMCSKVAAFTSSDFTSIATRDLKIAVLNPYTDALGQSFTKGGSLGSVHLSPGVTLASALMESRAQQYRVRVAQDGYYSKQNWFLYMNPSTTGSYAMVQTYANLQSPSLGGFEDMLTMSGVDYTYSCQTPLNDYLSPKSNPQRPNTLKIHSLIAFNEILTMRTGVALQPFCTYNFNFKDRRVAGRDWFLWRATKNMSAFPLYSYKFGTFDFGTRTSS